MFINQMHIWKELSYILPKLMKGENINLLLRAPSGYGKTKMAIMVTNLILPEEIPNGVYYLPDENGHIVVNTKYRIHIVDEAHKLKDQEMLYPLMDSGKYIFIFASNEAGELKEPLINRCIQFIFTDYSEKDMEDIVTNLLTDNGIKLPLEQVKFIVNSCSNNPRIATKLVQRLVFIIGRGHDVTLEALKNIFKDILQVNNGLTEIHQRYLDFLGKAGKASLDTISFSTKLDKGTIRFEVEPVLLYKGLIKITARGRELC